MHVTDQSKDDQKHEAKVATGSGSAAVCGATGPCGSETAGLCPAKELAETTRTETGSRSRGGQQGTMAPRTAPTATPFQALVGSSFGYASSIPAFKVRTEHVAPQVPWSAAAGTAPMDPTVWLADRHTKDPPVLQV